MRKATPVEIVQIGTVGPNMSPVLAEMIANPGTWYHVGLNEVGTGNLRDQMEGLEAEGARHGVQVMAYQIVGHRDGGYFALAA